MITKSRGGPIEKFLAEVPSTLAAIQEGLLKNEAWAVALFTAEILFTMLEDISDRIDR